MGEDGTALGLEGRSGAKWEREKSNTMEKKTNGGGEESRTGLKRSGKSAMWGNQWFRRIERRVKRYV